MSNDLHVYLYDRHVGVLKPNRRSFIFAYDEKIVATSPGTPLISVALPVQPERFMPVRTSNWFTGLLPEDEQKKEVARRFDVRPGDDFGLLREIGWECAGAVVILPSDRTVPPARLQDLTEAGLCERLRDLPSRPHDGIEALRVSLGGYQAKLLLTQTSEGWSMPLDGAISTHILKPEPSQWPGIAAAEGWVMTASREATPTAEVVSLNLSDAPPTLVVTRFDRDHESGALRRVHQEDGAQAMGLPPDRKYISSSPSHSDPSLLKIANLLERYAVDPSFEQARLLEQTVINVIVGNTDAHAKNVGILHPTDQTIALSPLYDVVPAIHFIPGQFTMGMRVGELARIDRVTVDRLVAEARSWGTRETDAIEVIERTLTTFAAGVGAADAAFPMVSENVRERTLRCVSEFRAALPASGSRRARPPRSP